MKDRARRRNVVSGRPQGIRDTDDGRSTHRQISNPAPSPTSPTLNVHDAECIELYFRRPNRLFFLPPSSMLPDTLLMLFTLAPEFWRETGCGVRGEEPSESSTVRKDAAVFVLFIVFMKPR